MSLEDMAMKKINQMKSSCIQHVIISLSLLSIFGSTYLLSLVATDRWSKPYFKGVPLPPRDSHTTTLIGQKLYVFGGTDGNSGLNDLHTLDICKFHFAFTEML